MITTRLARSAAAVLLFALAACGGTSDPSVTPGVPNGVYEIRGSIVSVDAPRLIVEINHEAIPGVMPAMTMPYEVAEPALLEGIAAGDRIRGTLRVDSRGYVITALARA